MERLVVMGAGYVGLPLAMRATEIGFDVVAYDVDEARIEALKAGTSYVEDVTDDDLRVALDTKRFIPTTDPNDLSGFDCAVVTVPTPLREGAPDLSYIESAASLLGSHVSPRCTVVLESTTYPGTTVDLFIPLIERASGLKAGVDFLAGYSPERIDPGNPQWGFVNTPKIVSGINDESLRAVQAFYNQLIDHVVPVGSTQEAELSKLLENTYRHVNVALVNELAVLCHELGIDVWSVVDAASTKPFGYARFTPGPGVGGHCLPIDPSFLSWQVKRSLGRTFRFVEVANDVNDHMPDYVVQRCAGLLNRRRLAVNGSRILVLGIAYKKNSGDARQSPGALVATKLARLGGAVHVADPMVEHGLNDVPAKMVNLELSTIDSYDLIVVATDHDAFDWHVLSTVSDRVLDTRNTHGLRGYNVERL